MQRGSFLSFFFPSLQRWELFSDLKCRFSLVLAPNASLLCPTCLLTQMTRTHPHKHSGSLVWMCLVEKQSLPPPHTPQKLHSPVCLAVFMGRRHKPGYWLDQTRQCLRLRRTSRGSKANRVAAETHDRQNIISSKRRHEPATLVRTNQTCTSVKGQKTAGLHLN